MSTSNKPKTGAQRTQEHYKRRKDAGLIQAKVWVHPDEAKQVRDYAAKRPLTKKVMNGDETNKSEFQNKLEDFVLEQNQTIREAIRIAELWEVGKMIGGDEDEVRNTLLNEVKRLHKHEVTK